MSSPVDRLVSDECAERLLAAAEEALRTPGLSLDVLYFAEGITKLCKDRQARAELDAIQRSDPAPLVMLKRA